MVQLLSHIIQVSFKGKEKEMRVPYGETLELPCQSEKSIYF